MMKNVLENVLEGKLQGPLIIGDPIQIEDKNLHKFVFAAKLDHNVKLQVVEEDGVYTAIINLVKEGEEQLFSFDEKYDPVLPVPFHEWKLFTDTAEFEVICGTRHDTISTMCDGYFGYAFATEALGEYMIYLFIPADVSDYERYKEQIAYLFGFSK